MTILHKIKGILHRPAKVKAVIVARAVFVAGEDELHKISLTFNIDPVTSAEFELPLPLAAKLISDLKTAYNAALPKHHSNIH